MSADAVEINPPGEPQACVLWLHGLGADGHDFEPLIPQLGLVESRQVRFVLPHAPIMPVTVNGGAHMRAWFDIAHPDLSVNVDGEGIRRSADFLDGLIAAEVARGVAPERIVLAGFSQGGVIALQSGLRYPQRLGGILALSTTLALGDSLDVEASDANRDIPIFMAHGLQDPVIPASMAMAAAERLKANGYPIAWHAYNMPHSVCPEEVGDIRKALDTMLFN